MRATDIEDLLSALDSTARDEGFSGLVHIDVDGGTRAARAYGFADRAHRIPATTATAFGVASVSKAFTAVTIASLIGDGALSLDQRARDLLRDDLPLIDDDVTVEHLLTHTSGIGDYIDESGDGDITDHVLDTPTHLLDRTEAFLPVVDGRPQVSAPGAAFAYNNSGYVVLALLAERAGGAGFHELVSQRVFAPAGLTDTGYYRMDDLPGGAAIGYLDDESSRTNVLHLPVRGSGDGGAYTTGEDLSRFWRSLLDGRIVDPSLVEQLTRPRHTVDEEELRYGAGFWLDLEGPGLILEGYDAGVSVRTRFDPITRMTVTIVANSSEGAWPVIGSYVDWLAEQHAS